MKRRIFILGIMILIMLTGVVQANFQSRPDVATQKSMTADNFFVNIRNMEATGQVMGLNATLNANGIETSASNNIDVHMIKNTEWGAIAILGASQYGAIDQNTQIGVAKSSTTSNNYGIFQMNINNSGEYVAGINNAVATTHGNLGKIKTMANTNSRYVDVYTGTLNNIPPKIGDATTGTYGTADWKGAQYQLGLGAVSKFILIRGYGAAVGSQNSIFSYVSSMGNSSTGYGESLIIGTENSLGTASAGKAATDVSSRAVVVCADGI